MTDLHRKTDIERASGRLRAAWLEADRASVDPTADRRAPTWDEARHLLVLRLGRAAAEATLAERLGAPPPAVADREDAVVSEALRDARAVRAAPASVGRLISQSDELVLCEGTVSAQACTPAVLRRYVVCDAAGRELGEVQQVAGTGPAVTPPSSVRLASDLHFHVLDRVCGQTFVFERAGDPLYVLDELGHQHGFVQWKPGEEPAAFRIVSSLDRGIVQVKTDAAHPFCLRVIDNVGEEVGRIERRFVGFGPFLRDVNQIRIRMEPSRLSPGQCWGLVAAALLAGIDDEGRADQSPASGS